MLYDFLPETKLIKVENFEEQAGKGIQARCWSSIKIGSRDFVLHTNLETDNKVLVVKLNLKILLYTLLLTKFIMEIYLHESV
jgi:Cu+-exporting ATPase